MDMLKCAERDLELDGYNCELYSVGTYTNVYGFCIYEHGQGRSTLICWDFGYDNLDRCEDAALAAVMRIMRNVVTTCFDE